METWDPALCGIFGAVSVPIFAVDGGYADVLALCCGATGGTNTFYGHMMPWGEGSLLFWTGGPLTGTNTGDSISITFTNNGYSVITATCGSSFVTFTNLLVRTEIDSSLKTNYLAYGGTNTVTLNFSTNAYGGVVWDTGSLNNTNNTTNSVTILPGNPDEYTVTATSLDTGACVDSAKVYIVKVDFTPNPLVIPIGATGQVSVAVDPISLESMLVFTNKMTNIAIVTGNAPLLDVTATTNAGLANITASINGVSLLSTGLVVVFTAQFTNSVIDVPENGTASGGVTITPADYTELAMTQLAYSSSDTNVATVTGGGSNFTITGVAYGTNALFITAPPFTNNLAVGDVTVVRVEVTTVTMAGPTFTPIKQDDSPQAAYAAPHWSGGTNSNPVAYQVGNTPNVSANFRVFPTNYNRVVYLKGSGTSQRDPSFELSVQSGSATGGVTNTVTYPATPASAAFGSGVNKDQLTISWRFSLNDQDYLSAKDSRNDYYLRACLKMRWSAAVSQTSRSRRLNPNASPMSLCCGWSRTTQPRSRIFRQALTLANPPMTYHTVIDVACRDSVGTTSTTDALTSLWPRFSSQIMARVDGTALRYYGGMLNTNAFFTTADLLRTTTGRCGAWQKLLIDVLGCHGITNTAQTIVPKPSGSFPITVSYYYKVATRPGIIVLPIPGQNNQTPHKAFFDHAVVWIGATIYDPSYGKIANSPFDWEDQALDKIEFTSKDDGLVYEITNQAGDGFLWTAW